MVQCKVCNGVYSPIQADGTQYFHRCPPLSRVELGAALVAGRANFPARKSLADYQAKASADGLTIDQAPLLAADDLLSVATFERVGLRDENLPGTRAVDAGKAKQPGAGTTPVTDVPAVVVVAFP